MRLLFLFATQGNNMFAMAKTRTKVKKLSYSEKVSLMSGSGAWTIKGNHRTKIPPTRLADGPCGLRKVGNDLFWPKDAQNSIAYPCPALAACSFDADLMEEYGRMLGREFRLNHVDAVLGPGMNIKRNPLGGRNFEYYSEDPYLSGKLAAAFTRGCQSVGVGTCLKHFACNSQESYRMVNDSVVDERALHEIYLRGFELAIKESNPWMVMAAYNRINGTFAAENKYLLTDILKGKWGYDGVVVSDWGGVSNVVRSHSNGLDVEMPCFQSSLRRRQLFFSIRNGKLSHKRVDDVAERVLLLSQRTHDATRKPYDFSYKEARELAQKIAEKSIVLLKNDGLLPLKSMKDIAIIGELAARQSLSGGGSSQVAPYAPCSFLDHCRASADKPSSIAFSRGYSLDPLDDQEQLAFDAVDLAFRSKKVLYFMGVNPDLQTEGIDRATLSLPEPQVALLDRLYEVNPNIIVVLCTSGPVELPFIDRVGSMLCAYYPGEAGAEALYRILLGYVSPSGHLAETWPVRNCQVPSFGFYPGGRTQSAYRESIYVGYRYYLTAGQSTRFPFGYGLSYTHFRFSNLKLSTNKYALKGALNVSLSVTNLNATPGDAVIQLYIEPQNGVVFKPTRTLQAFKRVSLGPNEKKEVVLTLGKEAFEHYETDLHDFAVEGGTYLIEIGDSCEDIKLKASVEVLSDAVFQSKRSLVPAYYKPPKDGFWQYEDEFESLLGRIVSLKKDPRTRPYTLNSTFEDIRETFIGRRLIKTAKKRMKVDDENDPKFTMFLQAPIRNVTMAGMKERTAHFIVNMANGSVFKAAVAWLFSHGE